MMMKLLTSFIHRLAFFVSIPARLLQYLYIFEHSSWNTPIGWGSAGFHLKPGATAVPPKSAVSFPSWWVVT